MMSDVSTDKKLKGKDLITIGIFSAIYFVINFAFMLLGGIHPVLWIRPISWRRLRNKECPLIMSRQLKLCHPMQC